VSGSYLARLLEDFEGNERKRSQLQHARRLTITVSGNLL
jgi:hypothetical protein